jgi:hypothetical protein
MDESLQNFVKNIILNHDWEFIGEMIYRSHLKTYISIKCTDVSNLQFEIKEYTTDEAIGMCMYSYYSKNKYLLDHPPHSLEAIVEYENKYSIEIPRLARIFTTYVSSAIFKLDKAPLNAYIDTNSNFYYGVFDFDEIRIFYGEDEEEDNKYNSRVINIFHERNCFLFLVVDGYEKGRIFDERCSSGLGSTELEVEFFLNSLTPNKFKHIKSIMQYMFL